MKTKIYVRMRGLLKLAWVSPQEGSHAVQHQTAKGISIMNMDIIAYVLGVVAAILLSWIAYRQRPRRGLRKLQDWRLTLVVVFIMAAVAILKWPTPSSIRQDIVVRGLARALEGAYDQLQGLKNVHERDGLLAVERALDDSTSRESRGMQLQEAARLFRAFLLASTGPEDSSFGYFYLGSVQGWLGQSDSALAYLHSSLEYKSEFAAAWFNLGGYLNEAGIERNDTSFFPKALEAFDSAQSHGLMDTDMLWVNRATVLGNWGHHDEAASCFDSAASKGFPSARAQNLKGIEKYRAGRFRDALNCYKTALDLYSLDDEPAEWVWYNIAISFDSIEQNDSSKWAFDSALTLRPCYQDAGRGKAEMLIRQGLIDSAIAALDAALDCDSTDAETRSLRDSILSCSH